MSEQHSLSSFSCLIEIGLNSEWNLEGKCSVLIINRAILCIDVDANSYCYSSYLYSSWCELAFTGIFEVPLRLTLVSDGM